MSEYETIRVEADVELAGLTTITLNRPHKLNAIDAQMHDEIERACRDLRADARARVVIVTGEGRAFSSGNDLTAERRGASSELEARHVAGAGSRSSAALESLEQVTIAAVNGLTVGGGVVWVSCCDLRIAAESAWFSIPEVDLALPLTWNALPRLMRDLGPARTKELVMTCDRFSSDDALRWGFINRVYPGERLMPEARALAAKLLAKDAIALALTKTTTNALARQMVPSEATQTDVELLLLSDLLARRRAKRD